jgi:hypothetical protein
MKTGHKQSGHTHIVDLTRTRIHRLEQLINLLIAHLLAQICQNVPQLSYTNEARHILIEHLKAATVVLRVIKIAEAAGTVEDA